MLAKTLPCRTYRNPIESRFAQQHSNFDLHHSPPAPHHLSTTMAPALSKAASPLLNLPAELRISIYSHFCSMKHGPMQEYQGIFLSCTQIYFELEKELVKNVTESLAKVQQVWDVGIQQASIGRLSAKLRIAMPVTVAEAQNVAVSVPSSVLRFQLLDTALCFCELEALHFSSLTFTFHKSDEWQSLRTFNEQIGFGRQFKSFMLHKICSLLYPVESGPANDAPSNRADFRPLKALKLILQSGELSQEKWFHMQVQWFVLEKIHLQQLPGWVVSDRSYSNELGFRLAWDRSNGNVSGSDSDISVA